MRWGDEGGGGEGAKGRSYAGREVRLRVESGDGGSMRRRDWGVGGNCGKDKGEESWVVHERTV